MKTSYKYFSLSIVLLGTLVTFFAPSYLHAQAAPESALDVVKAYLRATRARDLETSYRYISSRDRNVQDKNSYLHSQENFSGFALDLARRLAAEMDVWVNERQLGSAKARFEVGYRAPTADEISSQLRDWDIDKLNALSGTQQTGLITSLEKVKKTGKMITIEGRETFDLVLEKTGWKVFLDWGSQQRVELKTQPRAAELAIAFPRKELLVKPEEPFQVDFKVTNRSHRAVVVKLNHVFAPRKAEKNIDMIACGSLIPFSLRPQETQQLSSAYILRSRFPRTTALEIIYDFRLAPRGRKPEAFTN
jgi:hypothetical protein